MHIVLYLNMKILKSTFEIPIRFSNADPMGIVWHGHYIQYFEDGREAFGKEHGISYRQVVEHNFTIPIVSISCDYKRPLKYGDTVIIETIYKNSDAAKIEFDYILYRGSDSLVAATGKSTQVFLNASGELQLLSPDFIVDWKNKNGLL